MEDDTLWAMAWISAICLSAGLGVYQESLAACLLCAGFLGFGLISISIIGQRWYEIKQFINSRRES